MAVFGGNPPQNVPGDPTLTFLICRVLPNDNEVMLNTFVMTDPSVAVDDVIRAQMYSYTRGQRLNNPGWRIVVYGPTNGGYWTGDDIIWNSSLPDAAS